MKTPESTSSLFLVTIGMAALAAWPLAAAPTALDRTFAGFGEGGIVTTQVPLMDTEFERTSMTLAPDGSILVVGRAAGSILVLKFLEDGKPDPSFSEDGMATFSQPLFFVSASAAAVQPDGKIVIAGMIETHPRDFLIARITPSGALDVSFGAGGFVSYDFGGDEDYATSVVVQADGKIVAAGWARIEDDYDFAAVRLHPNGQLDSTFSDNGRETVGFGGSEGAEDMALLPDGRLILVGTSWDLLVPPFGSDFGILCLGTDGTPYRGFDGDGKVVTALGHDLESARSVCARPDGSFVVLGNGFSGPFFSGFMIARYLSDGRLDGSFDGDGKSSYEGTDTPRSVALYPDGRIVVVGARTSDSDSQVVVSRLNSDGSRDTAFDGDGQILLDFAELASGQDVAVLPDGRILVYATRDGYPILIRLLPDGSLDDGGRQMLAFEDASLGPRADERAHAMVIDSQGRIVLVGAAVNAEGNEADFALARFLPDGGVDASFGERGGVRFGFAGYEEAWAAAIQPDDKIVAAGFTRGSSGVNFMVARFHPTGEIDAPAFSVFGFNVIDVLGGDDFATDVAIAPDGKILVTGHAFNGERYIFTVVRLTARGLLDNSFDADGKATFDFGGVHGFPGAVAIQADGKIVAAGTFDGDFALVRFHADGSVDRDFGFRGAVATEFGGGEVIHELSIQPDGAIVAAGWSVAAGNGDFAIARYTPRGILDTTFGPDGRVLVDFGGLDRGWSLDIRGDGSIVTAGCADGLFAVAQLTSSGALDATFGEGGTTTTDVGGTGDCATSVAFVEGKILAGGYQVDGGMGNFAVARYVTATPASSPCRLPPCGGGQTPSDANQDARLDISDAVWLLNHLFSGSNPTLPCDGGTASHPGSGAQALLDANDDGGIDIADPVRVLAFLFSAGPPPAHGTSCTPILGCPARCGSRK